MSKYIRAIAIIILFASTTHSEVIFSSKWDSATTGGAGTENDGGNWDYAVVASGDLTLERVSGDQSGSGGPTSVPPGSGATYMLKETMHPDGTDGQLYLQENFAAEHQGLTDYYGGMWVYINSGATFRNSIKFFDFRTENPYYGSGHLALFGFDHNAMGCGSGVHSSWNTAENLCGYPDGHNIMVFRYLDGAESVVSADEYNWNYYDSPVFETNFDSVGAIIDEVDFTVNEPDRIPFEGGVWIAYIFHVKVHATDGQFEVWTKSGTDPLKQVINWNRDTVWDQATGPHNFYTLNGSTGIDHFQVNAYWNEWIEEYTDDPGNEETRILWFSNVIIATTYAEVENYLLGGSGGSLALRGSFNIH